MTRASAALKYRQLQKQIWIGCLHLKNTTRQQRNKLANQGTEVFIRNVVLDGIRKILETYYMEKSWKLYDSENSENLDDRLATAYFNIVKLLH